MTKGDLIDRILTGLNEATVGPVFWTRVQIGQIVADGMDVLAEELASIKRTAFVTLGPGKLYYRTRGLHPDFRLPYRMWLASNNRKLVPVTVEELDAFHLQWSTINGDPEYWCPMGLDWFALYPHPSTPGGVLRIDYLAWPREMTNDDDRPEFPDADHESLVLYGVYDGLLKRWAVPEATAIFSQFLDTIGKGKARSGVNQLNGRTWQKGQAPNPGFSAGIGWRGNA